MSLLMENSVVKIGCGDPGDPIPFAALIQGNNYLQFPAAGASTKKALFNLWVKGVSDAFNSYIYSSPDLAGSSYFYLGHSGNQTRIIHRDVSNQFDLSVEGFARDGAAFRNLHLEIDTTQPVAEDRVKLWVNGVLVTLTGTFPALDYAMTKLGGAAHQYVSSWVGSFGTPADGPGHYAANVAYGDDPAAYSFSDFGRFNAQGFWVSKELSDLSGLRYFLPFSDQANMGLNLAGEDLIETGTVQEVDDTPTDNMAVLDRNGQYLSTLSNGDLTAAASGGSGVTMTNGTFVFPSTGSWKYAMNVGATATSATIGARRGAALARTGAGGSLGAGNWEPGEIGYNAAAGTINVDGVTVQSGLTAAVANDIIGAEYNSETEQFQFYLNNTPIGAPVAYQWSADLVPAFSKTQGNGDYTVDFAPTGFASNAGVLRSSNIPCPDIINPEDYFTSRDEIGGADIAGLNFDPTSEKVLIASKRIDATGTWRMVDTLGGATKYWAPDPVAGSIENTDANGLQAFTADGALIGSSSDYQGTRRDFIWRASPLAGFDIVDVDHTSGAATTVSQNAGGAIDYAWAPNLDGGDIRVFHRCLPDGGYVLLNKQSNAGTDIGWLTSTANTVTIGASMPTGRYRLYLWRAVPQFSAFFDWDGTANSNGPMGMLDFKARVVSYVGTSTSGGGVPYSIHTASNDNGSPSTKYLWIDDNTAENTAGEVIDMNSNSVKQRIASGRGNWAGIKFLGSAWALVPGKFATAQ